MDIVVGSFGYSLGACGGFCAGSIPVVDHQRLSGQAYCFSASLPALLAASALISLSELENNQELIIKLNNNCQLLYDLLLQKLSNYFKISNIEDDVNNSFRSPMIHLYLKSDSQSHDECSMKLQMIVEQCIKKGLLVTRAKYIESQESFPDILQPSIRIGVSAAMTEADIKLIASRLLQAVQTVKI